MSNGAWLSLGVLLGYGLGALFQSCREFARDYEEGWH